MWRGSSDTECNHVLLYHLTEPDTCVEAGGHNSAIISQPRSKNATVMTDHPYLGM